jgi:hypothetical protein
VLEVQRRLIIGVLSTAEEKYNILMLTNEMSTTKGS